jgi:hypothetical protein
MKICAYFFDKYTRESIWIATLLWPIYTFIFYLFYKRIPISIIYGLLLASFSCLIFANTLIEYLVFFAGFSLILFGALGSLENTKKAALHTTIGVTVTILCGLIMYLFRTKVYGRTKIPKTNGVLNTIFSPGGLVWLAIMLGMFVYVYYEMIYLQ